MKIRVDEEKCCSAGQCVLAGPELFAQHDSNGVVVLLEENPDTAQYAAAREAERICPAAAITIDED